MLIPVYEAPLLPFFYFPKSLHSQVGKKGFFTTFFPGFLEWAFHPGLILKTFSKGKKIIFCMVSCKIMHLGEFAFLSNVVLKAQSFFPLKILVLPQWHPSFSKLGFQVHNNCVEMNLPAQFWNLRMSFRQNKKFSGEKKPAPFWNNIASRYIANSFLSAVFYKKPGKNIT